MRAVNGCGWMSVLALLFFLFGCTNYEQDKKKWAGYMG